MNNPESLVWWNDESQLLGYGESDSTGPWVKFRVELEALEKFRGLKGTVFYLTAVKIQDNGEPEKTDKVSKPEKSVSMEEHPQGDYVRYEDVPQWVRDIMAETRKVELGKPWKPYGQLASELYKRGFFHTQKEDHFVVCEAIGTPEQFLEWVRQQPCAKTGKFDYHKDEATGTTIERCEPAHYNGDSPGKGIKADYSAIPLVHAWHHWQTIHGYSVFDPSLGPVDRGYGGIELSYAYPFNDNNENAGRDWMRAQAAKYREKWAHDTLLELFGCDSLGNLPPKELRDWAVFNPVHDLKWALPEGYREDKP